MMNSSETIHAIQDICNLTYVVMCYVLYKFYLCLYLCYFFGKYCRAQKLYNMYNKYNSTFSVHETNLFVMTI